MSVKDEIDMLISELRTKRIRGREKIKEFIDEKKLSLQDKTEFYKRLQDNYSDDHSFEVSDWITKNLIILIEKNPNGLVSILESRVTKGSDYVSNLLLNLREIDLLNLLKMYGLLKDSTNNELEIASGYVLGEIAIRDPQFLTNEIMINVNIDDDKRISYLMALRISSNRYRNNSFVLTITAAEFIILCTKSQNDKLRSDAIFTCVVLFEYDSRFKDVLYEYFLQLPEHRIYIYRCLDQNDLSDQTFELSLLDVAVVSNSDEELNLVQWVLGSKIFRSQHPTNRYLDKHVLQLFTLDFFQKLLNRTDIQASVLGESLLTSVGDIDIQIASDYLMKWITKGISDKRKYQFFYPSIIYSIFKNHEDEFELFLRNLSKHHQNFDIIICYSIKEMVSDIRSRFDSEFTIFNKTIIRDLKQLIKNHNLHKEIEILPAKDLDDLSNKMSNALEIVNRYQITQTDPDYLSLQHKRKDLKSKIDFIRRKTSLVNSCLTLLTQMGKENKIRTEKLTRNFRGGKILDMLRSCEIIRTELTETKKEHIDCESIKHRLPSFPNIEKHLGYRWLDRECRQGYPYHMLLVWLSKLVNLDHLSQLLSEWEIENDHYQKEIKRQNLRYITWPLLRLRHLDRCLGYFSKGNEQGKGIIIGGIKSENFSQFLTQLEIASKLKRQGYKISLEVPIVDKRIDILASKDESKLVFELATLDLYVDMKYSGFAADIPDRAKAIMIEKITDQISVYAKYYSAPMIIVLNLTYAYDTDLYGVNYALQGSELDNMVFGERSEIVKRFTTFERDQNFLALEDGNKLSALIFCREEFGLNDSRLLGDVILNATAERKLDQKSVLEIKQALFES